MMIFLKKSSKKVFNQIYVTNCFLNLGQTALSHLKKNQNKLKQVWTSLNKFGQVWKMVPPRGDEAASANRKRNTSGTTSAVPSKKSSTSPAKKTPIIIVSIFSQLFFTIWIRFHSKFQFVHLKNNGCEHFFPISDIPSQNKKNFAKNDK